ncbi:hypothetical protein [Deinococcus sp. QL22]|uniref:hypothetical protein n=1 Tax=Deinococcus sp. QL22 TaxID=2939437 RepID=UPI00201747F3|nr:hypothetical protein [Deinococcus sp. QL22]UQN08769.1 hypothetical protein M1R55_21885 [Deinococcus sp. QL22]
MSSIYAQLLGLPQLPSPRTREKSLMVRTVRAGASRLAPVGHSVRVNRMMLAWSVPGEQRHLQTAFSSNGQADAQLLRRAWEEGVTLGRAGRLGLIPVAERTAGGIILEACSQASRVELYRLSDVHASCQVTAYASLTVPDPARGFWNPLQPGLRGALRRLKLQTGDHLMLITHTGSDSLRVWSAQVN